jgi:hypothetical protein
MKTFVVLAGLMVIVPRTDDTGQWRSLNVLVLDPQAAGDRLGETVHDHFTMVTSFQGRHEELVGNMAGDWTIRSTAATPIQLVGDERYLFLSRVYGEGELPPLRPECYGPGAVTQCTSSTSGTTRPLLKAQLTFTGGWRIRPIEVTHDREPRTDVYDDSTWGFLRFEPGRQLPLATPHQIQLSSSLILESTDPPDVSEVIVDDPQGNDFDLVELDAETCMVFAAYPGPCAVVRFLNTGTGMSEGSHRVEIEYPQTVVYELFQDMASLPRYVLFLRKDGRPEAMDVLFPGGGGTVGDERPCSPTMFAPPVRATP